MLIATLFLTLLAAPQAEPQERVDYLLKACQASSIPRKTLSDAMDMGYCFGFLDGLSRSVILTKPAWYCPADEVTTAQLVKIFINWANRHPEQHHLYMIVGASRALEEAFPCRK